MATPINIPAQIDIVKVNGIDKVATQLQVSPALVSAITRLDSAIVKLGADAQEVRQALNFSNAFKSGQFDHVVRDLNKTVQLYKDLSVASNNFINNPSLANGGKIVEVLNTVGIKGKEAQEILNGVAASAANALTKSAELSQRGAISNVVSEKKNTVSLLAKQQQELLRQSERAAALGQEQLARKLKGQAGGLGGTIKSVLGINPTEANNLSEINQLFERVQAAKIEAERRGRTISRRNSTLDRDEELKQAAAHEAKLTKLREQGYERLRARGDAAAVKVATSGQRENDKFISDIATGNLKTSTAEAKENMKAFRDRVNESNKAFDVLDRISGRTKKQIDDHVLSADKFGQAISLAFKRFAAFLGPSSLLLGLTFAFRNAIREANEFEKILTRIRQVTDQPRSQIEPLGQQFVGLSRSTGVSASEVGKGILTLAQAGFNKPDELASVAEKLVKVPLAPTFDDIATTLDGLLAIFGQFNKTLSDTGEIFDVVNQFAADFAIESKDIFEITKRGGATFSVAGGSLQDFLRLSSTLRETTRQSPETIGTFFKTATAELISPKSQQLLQGLGIGPGNITDQLTKLAEVFAERFGKKIEGPQAVGLASELVGNRQLDKLLGLLRGLNDPNLQKRLDLSLNNATGSFDRSAQKRLDDIGQSLDRISQSFQGFFRLATQNEPLRNFVKLIADLAQGVGVMSDGFAKSVPQIVAFGAALGSPFFKEVFLGAKGRLFGLRGKQLDDVLDANRKSLVTGLRSSNLSEADKAAFIDQEQARLRADTERKGTGAFKLNRRLLATGGLLVAGKIAGELAPPPIGNAVESASTGGVLAASLGFGPFGIAVTAVTLGLNSFFKSLSDANNEAIDSAKTFAQLNNALTENSLRSQVVQGKDNLVDAVSALFKGDFAKAGQIDAAVNGDQTAKFGLLRDRIGSNQGIGAKINSLANQEVTKALKGSKLDLTKKEDSQRLLSVLVGVLANDPEFIKLVGLQGIDVTDQRKVNELAAVSIRQSPKFKSSSDIKQAIKFADETSVEVQVNKAADIANKLSLAAVDSIKRLTEGLDKLSSVITNPLDLVTARLNKDPVAALKSLSDSQLSQFNLDPESIRNLVEFNDKFINANVQTISAFLSDSTILTKETGKTVGQARIDVLRDAINSQGIGKEDAKRAAQSEPATSETGARRITLSQLLADDTAAKSLGFFNKSGTSSEALKSLDALQIFKKFQSGTQIADVAINSLNKVLSETSLEAQQFRDIAQSNIDILNKRLEIERTLRDGLRETNNQIFEFAQKIQSISLAGLERNIGTSASLNGTNPNVVDLQTVAALRGASGSSFGSIGAFAQSARGAAFNARSAQEAAQSARISGSTKPQPFLDAAEAVSKYQDIQSELNQRLNESNTRLGLFAKVTDTLKASFERLKGSFEGVGQSLFGTSQQDFAQGLYAFSNFLTKFGSTDLSKATPEKVGGALNGLSDQTIENLVKFLGVFQNISLGSNVTGGDLLKDIQTSIALPAIAAARSAVSGRSADAELKDVAAELKAAQAKTEQAQAQENAVRAEQLVLIRLQQELASQNVDFFTKQSELAKQLSEAFGGSDGLNASVNKISENVQKIADAIGGGTGKANGGVINGGIAGKDSVHIMGMPGEYVVSKRGVDANGVALLDYINKGGKVRGMAGGGILYSEEAPGFAGVPKKVREEAERAAARARGRTQFYDNIRREELKDIADSREYAGQNQSAPSNDAFLRASYSKLYGIRAERRKTYFSDISGHRRGFRHDQLNRQENALNSQLIDYGQIRSVQYPTSSSDNIPRGSTSYGTPHLRPLNISDYSNNYDSNDYVPSSTHNFSGFGQINQSIASNYRGQDYGSSRRELVRGRNNENQYNTLFNNLTQRYGGNTKNSEFIRNANRLNQRYGKDSISNQSDLDRYISNRGANRSQENQSKSAINVDSSTQASAVGDSINGTLVPKFDELINVQKQMLDKLSAPDKGTAPKFELSISPISVNVNLTAPDILKLAGDSLYKAVVVAMKPKLVAAFKATGNQESVSQVEGL